MTMKLVLTILFLIKSDPDSNQLTIAFIALGVSIFALLITAIFYFLNLKLNYKTHLLTKENIKNLTRLEEIKNQPILNIYIKDSICYLINNSNAVAKEIIVNFNYQKTSYQPINRLFVENFDISGIDGNLIYKMNLMSGNQLQLFTYDSKLEKEIIKALSQIDIEISYRDITGKPFEVRNALVFC
jgi:hypothetical protein